MLPVIWHWSMPCRKCMRPAKESANKSRNLVLDALFVWTQSVHPKLQSDIRLEWSGNQFWESTFVSPDRDKSWKDRELSKCNVWLHFWIRLAVPWIGMMGQPLWSRILQGLQTTEFPLFSWPIVIHQGSCPSMVACLFRGLSDGRPRNFHFPTYLLL